MLGAADISLVTLNKHLGQLNVPSKTFPVMAGARPVLAAVPENSEITRIVHEADCGVWCPPENPPAMAEAIRQLSHQPERLDRYGANGRSYVEQHYTRELILNQHRQLLLETADRGS